MGIFTSLLAPILKTGAVIGASAIPGIGPVAGPVVAGLMQAGDSAMRGQGPLSSLASGAMAGGMSAGMGALNNAFQPAEGAANASQFANNFSLAGQGQQDYLTEWSKRDLMGRMAGRNSFMGGF